MTQGIGNEFMTRTRYEHLGPSDQQQGRPQPPLQLPYDERARIIDLPAPQDLAIPPLDLREAIENRRTVRRYAQHPLTLDELSFVLWCTQGVQGVQGVQGTYSTLRTVPSGVSTTMKASGFVRTLWTSIWA